MILCDDWGTDPNSPLRVNIIGLLLNIHPLEFPPYPVWRDLCVFLALTECRGTGVAQITCVLEETGEKVFETPRFTVTFGPTLLRSSAFRSEFIDVPFPELGSTCSNSGIMTSK
jgi:hypothetical protein